MVQQLQEQKDSFEAAVLMMDPDGYCRIRKRTVYGYGSEGERRGRPGGF